MPALCASLTLSTASGVLCATAVALLRHDAGPSLIALTGLACTYASGLLHALSLSARR